MNPNEIWQVDVSGQIYEASLAELTEWIAEGSLLPGDRVRRGNLRWLDAIKVPSLYGFFNAKELGIAPPTLAVTTIDASEVGETSPSVSAPETALMPTENFPPPQTFSSNQTGFETNVAPTAAPHFAYQTAPQNYQAEYTQQTFSQPPPPPPPPANVCVIHPDNEPAYGCDGCGNLFCKGCPTSYGGSVKVCPLCGAMCRSLAQAREQQQKAIQYQKDLAQGFGFDDFGRALAYPFKFKTSLIAGAIMFMFFTLGQSASGVGGIFMKGAAIFCWMLANMLTFGVLANTMNNMSQGRLHENFMPSFDDFNLWDDVVHPFFLSLAAYVSSFGLVIVVVAVAIFYTFSSAVEQQGEAIKNMGPQMEHAREQMRKAPGYGHTAEEQALIDDETPPMTPAEQQALEDGDIEKLQRVMQENRKKELESIVGQTPETKQQELREMFGRLAAVAIPLFLLLVVGVLWGLFYFPAACAVAGYTRSFWATLNPLVGLDTIKRIGFDYAKILLMLFILSIASGIVSFIFGLLFSPFDLPGVGNLPAVAVGSFFTFYFAVVFALILGLAMYKNSAKLNLYRG